MKPTISKHNKILINIKFDLRVLCGVLALIIIVMLAFWRPWTLVSNVNDRTITIRGEATVSAKPDQFIFYPYYEFDNSDRQDAINSAGQKSTEIVTKLKSLGLADSQIKTTTSAYDAPNHMMDIKEPTNTYTLSITIKIKNEVLAQTVQDYLSQTAPSGSFSPQVEFSESKRKELENIARDNATKDAKSKAVRMANNLGFKLGKVKSVSDGYGFGVISPMRAEDTISISGTSGSSTVSANSIQPGENNINYSVIVVYYLK